MAVHMALIGETCRRGSLRQAGPLPDQVAAALQPAHQQETMRAGAAELAEMARQFEPVEASQTLQLGGSHQAVEIARQVFAGEPHLVPGGISRRTRPPLGLTQQAFGDALQQGIDEQLLERMIEFAQRLHEDGAQPGIGDDGLGDERQSGVIRAQRLQKQRGLQIEHAIAEADFCPRPAVMLLIGM